MNIQPPHKEWMAVCPRDGTPLVFTFVFYKKEWYCLECGEAYEMFGASSVEATVDLQTKYEELEKEFRPIEADLLVIGALKTDCSKCSRREDYSHLDHATNKEKSKDIAARQALRDRITIGLNVPQTKRS